MAVLIKSKASRIKAQANVATEYSSLSAQLNSHITRRCQPLDNSKLNIFCNDNDNQNLLKRNFTSRANKFSIK